jgi:hypothetical protein
MCWISTQAKKDWKGFRHVQKNTCLQIVHNVMFEPTQEETLHCWVLKRIIWPNKSVDGEKSNDLWK